MEKPDTLNKCSHILLATVNFNIKIKLDFSQVSVTRDEICNNMKFEMTSKSNNKLDQAIHALQSQRVISNLYHISIRHFRFHVI